jgi:MFS family permease
VGRAQLANAVSLNSAVFTAARVVGPAVAGVLIAVVGTGWCFLLNGVSYLPVAAGLMLMRPGELHVGPRAARQRGQVMEGLRYAWSRAELRLPLLLMAVIGTLAFNFSVVLPLMATTQFHGGSSVYGLLLSVMGVGALGGALLAAARQSPTIRLLSFGALGFGAFMVAAALMPNLPLELVALVPMGALMVTVQATANSLLQLSSDPMFRGRVMALYVMVFIGTTPIGGPIVGFVAQHFGAREALALGGVASALAGVAVLAAIRRGAAGEQLASPRPIDLPA